MIIHLSHAQEQATSRQPTGSQQAANAQPTGRSRAIERRPLSHTHLHFTDDARGHAVQLHRRARELIGDGARRRARARGCAAAERLRQACEAVGGAALGGGGGEGAGGPRRWRLSGAGRARLWRLRWRRPRVSFRECPGGECEVGADAARSRERGRLQSMAIRCGEAVAVNGNPMRGGGCSQWQSNAGRMARVHRRLGAALTGDGLRG